MMALGDADMAVQATSSIKGGVRVSSNDLEQADPVAPDRFNPALATDRREIWSYYCYYIGDNGLTLFNFAPTAFQNLLYQAAGDSGVLHFAGANRTINSIVLLSNGISFAIQTVIFIALGSFADFGSWRPNILIVLSIIAWAIGFSWMGVYTPDKWLYATGLYIVGLIAYQTTVTFWTAAFPSLARNTPELRLKAEEFSTGGITRDEYDYADSLKRSELSNMAFYIQSMGEIIILAVIVGIMWGLKVNDSEANNNYGLSVLLAFTSGIWILMALPWFVFEKRRPGQQVPAGMNIVTVGLWQIYRAFKQIWKLKQSFLYLLGYFLLGDSLNTTVTVISTLQNEVVAYNSLQLTYLLLASIAAQACGIYSYWWVQKRFQLSVKFMFNIIAASITLLDVWGMIGIWTHRFGFHNLWEIWVYQIYYGFVVCPWYSYSQIMISEVTPRGKEFLFFALFSVIGKTSSFIGPLVSTAIIQTIPSHNNSSPFYFLTGLSVLSFGILCFVDVGKSRVEQARFLEEEAAALSVIEAGDAGTSSDLRLKEVKGKNGDKGISS